MKSLKRLVLVILVIGSLIFSKTEVSANINVPILMYHFIGNNPNPKDKARDTLSVSPEKFEAQMEYLSKQQLTDSKNVLQSQTGYPVNFIAFPYGVSNASIQAAAKKAGFVGGLGTWYGKAAGGGMNLPRLRITGQMSLKDFASRL